MNTARRARRLAAVTGLLLLPALAVSQAAAQEELRVTTPVRMTAGDPNPSRTYQDPATVILPDDPTTAVTASVDLRARQCRVLRSTNSGHSWELLDSTPMPDPDSADCFHTGGTFTQTPMATGGGGRVYYGLTDWPGEEGPRDHAASELNALVGYSDDAGDSWTTTTVRDSTDWDGAGIEANRILSLAVDARGGNDDVVYASWDTRYGDIEDEDEEPIRQPSIAVSTNGGDSYSDRIVPVPDDAEDELGGDLGLEGSRAELAVDDDGVLYAVFDAAPEDAEPRLAVTRSDDQGATFTYNDITDPEEMPDYAYHVVAWSPEGGADGTLHVVYESDVAETPQGTRDIYHQRSTDGGESWSEPVMLNDDDGVAGQYNAQIDVAPDGRVDVAWFDFRDGQERYSNDIYYTHSDDNGESWRDNARVTDQSVNRHIGTWSNDFDMRGTPGVASTDEFAYITWSDTRHADHAGQSQDIYGAAVQHEDLGRGGAGLLPLVLAGVGGLFAAGALLFGVGLGIRMRGQPGQPAPAGGS